MKNEYNDLIKKIPTCELVDELSKRIGVEKTVIKPYQNKNISFKGPSVILKIID